MNDEMKELLRSLPKKTAAFIEPMECTLVTKPPEGPRWVYEIKLDGYRALGVKVAREEVILFSRRANALNKKFPHIAEALHMLPPGTVVDGELVAIDDHGRPNFQLLQNFRENAGRIYYYVFDVLICGNRDVTQLPLTQRRELLSSLLDPSDQHLKMSDYVETSAQDMLGAVREHGLEGIVAKRKDSRYEAGLRTGAWTKFRLNRGQELVIGGYTPARVGLDALIVGYYRGPDLLFAAKVRNGFVPASRRELFERLKKLPADQCPFANLPETGKSQWGEGLDAEKMKECKWVKPELVARIDFLEWTNSAHLRHPKFVSVRDDKDPRKVVKET